MPHRFGIRERTTCREFNSLDRVSSNCAAVAGQRERVETGKQPHEYPEFRSMARSIKHDLAAQIVYR
ncbi:hypothetical protein DF049_11365 [Burkholderia cenocepacia]|nr:hypothetical protein C6P63_19495 [Burkholderia cenocepacia]RQU78800.1 hypothetical protein DF049_11365 [Burkholderia cenocepacia]